MDEEQAGRPVAVARKTRARAAPRRRPTRKKPVRWSAKRAARFLEELAQCSNVAASARAAGIAESTIYRRRLKDEAFRAEWQAALREGVSRLETMLLERALNGVEKAVWHGGKQVGSMREYSDRLALALLAAHRGALMGDAAPSPASADELRAQLLQRFGDMNRAMGGDG